MKEDTGFDIEKVLAEFPPEMPPATLVKFFDHHGLDVLVNGELKVTPPGELNDPFELNPRLSSREISKEEMREHLLDPRGYMREGWRRNYSGRTEAQFQEYVEACVAAGRPEDWLKHVVEIVKDYARGWGIASFSAFSDADMRSPDAIRHWAIYGKDHTGIAIEFDGENEFFKRWCQHRFYFRVRYEGRPEADLAEFDEVNQETAVQLIRKWAAVNSPAWERENEWRWVFRLDDAEDFPCRSVIDGERLIHLRPLWDPKVNDGGAKIVKRVIFGCRTSDQLKASVRTALGQPHLSHVEIWQASEHANEFRLELRRIG